MLKNLDEEDADPFKFLAKSAKDEEKYLNQQYVVRNSRGKVLK